MSAGQNRWAASADETTNKPDKRLLAVALREAEFARWRYQRSHHSTINQAQIAMDTVEDIAGRILRVCDVSPRIIKQAAARWLGQGKSPSMINSRLATLSTMGVNCRGLYVPLPRRLKWWMSPDIYEDFAKIVPADSTLRRYVDWAGATGFRIEESLRLTRSHFFKEFTAVTVPGSKTGGAQATLPLSDTATAIAVAAFRGREAHPDTRMFPTTYVDVAR